MKLSLPQDDPNPEARAAALADHGAAYAYSREHLGALFVRELPHGEAYDASFAVAGVSVTAQQLRNRTTQSTASWPPRAEGEGDSAVAEAVSAVARRLEATRDKLPPRRPTNVAGYDDLHATTERPIAFGLVDDDAFFAWRQVAGMTPVLIRGVDAIPENVPLDDATFARAVGGSDRLGAALAEGRLFVTDYAPLVGLVAGQSEGLQKYVYAPVAVFVRAADGALRPVAIQVGQRPEPDAPLWTPADGVAWRMAKAVVNNADMLYNGIVAHFAFCHLTVETLVCVSHRTLAEAHPLMHLFAPHFRFTLAANALARKSIINPGGTQEYLLGGTLASNFEMMLRVFEEVRFDAIGLRADLAARRVDDPARLPSYPLRDDGVPVADAIDRWVDAYLRLYYAGDEAVRGDGELRAWAATLAGDGRFHGMPALDSIASLARFVSDLLWRITGYHAVVNNGGWDFASWATETPSALFGPAPRRGATEEAWRAMLPPLSVANGMLEQMHSLRNIRLNALGAYPERHFDDPRVREPLERLQTELRAIGAATAARDAARPWPFPYLHPHQIANSIHV
jgi:arachidonate 15-lipoxygenase